MARRSAAELGAGAVVLLVAAGFLAYAVASTGRSAAGGYGLHAAFGSIAGLAVGADVRLAGVKVGSVQRESIDPKSFLATVDFTVQDGLHLPTDSSAAITSDGLLGGMYLSLSPGGSDKTIPPGGAVTITQSSINIEELLGKFIFSVGNLSGATKPAPPGPAAGATGSAPAGGTAGGFVKPLQ